MRRGRRREVFPSRADALTRYASRTPLGVWRADALAAYVEHGFEDLPDGTVRLKCRAESEARTFECETKMTLERIEGFAVPTVVAVGSEEPTGAMFGQPIVDVMANARLAQYPHLGHFGPLQDPASIGADVLAAATSIRGMSSWAHAGSRTSPRGAKPDNTGFTSSTGVPSIASRPRTPSVSPSTVSTRQVVTPIRFGRSFAR